MCVHMGTHAHTCAHTRGHRPFVPLGLLLWLREAQGPAPEGQTPDACVHLWAEPCEGLALL